MKILTEFIIYHEDISMPPEEKLCPLLWQSTDFDSDGDFYYDNIDQRWTQLELESIVPDELNSKLTVYVYREHDRNYEPSILEIIQLRRYVEYQKKGQYEDSPVISNIQKPAVASFQFETCSLEHYKDFLKTIHYFLSFSKGCLVNHLQYNADEFAKDFLKNS